MDRNAIEAVLHAAYAARKSSDLEGVLRHFAPGAVFSLSGSTAASPVPMVATGMAAIREVMRRLMEGFEFKNIEFVTMLVDGDQAAVHWHVQVKALGTGLEAETDIVDLVRFDGDKIASFRQFADTALINHMIGV